jgi:5-methylcytosine-specific restriction endonuclease McrA/predicted kinase
MPVRPPLFRPQGQRTAKQGKRETDSRRLTSRQRGYDWRWEKARRVFLGLHPLCRHCKEQGFIVTATVVDHIIPHRGDMALFWDTENWQSLCTPCHARWKQREENAAVSKAAAERANPTLSPSRIPLVIVCGPPGSGKSTYVQRHKGPDDLVIDLDVIRSTLAGTGIHQANPAWTGRALDERNRILAGLATDTTHQRAWFIIAAPDPAEREMWKRKLGAVDVVLMDTPRDECIRRINADPSRIGEAERMAMLVDAWFIRAERPRVTVLR